MGILVRFGPMGDLRTSSSRISSKASLNWRNSRRSRSVASC